MIQKFPAMDTVPIDVIETEKLEVQSVTWLIRFVTNWITSNEIENIFIKLLIPKTKPITVGIVYKPPDQTRFLEILSGSLNWLNMLTEECHISGDLNINLYKNGSTLEEENKNIIKGANKISSETKNI